MTREEARQRPCTKHRCNARAGDLCRRPNGKRTQAVHAERKQPQQAVSERAA